MGLLAKIGQIALKATEIVMGFAPVAQTMYPNSSGAIQTVSQDFAQVAGIIQQIEIIGQKMQTPGAQKLQMAAPLVAQVILQSSVLVNHKISQPDLFQQGCTKVADGWADILNSLNESGVTSVDKT